MKRFLALCLLDGGEFGDVVPGWYCYVHGHAELVDAIAMQIDECERGLFQLYGIYHKFKM